MSKKSIITNPNQFKLHEIKIIIYQKPLKGKYINIINQKQNMKLKKRSIHNKKKNKKLDRVVKLYHRGGGGGTFALANPTQATIVTARITHPNISYFKSLLFCAFGPCNFHCYN